MFIRASQLEQQCILAKGTIRGSGSATDVPGRVIRRVDLGILTDGDAEFVHHGAVYAILPPLKNEKKKKKAN